MAYPTHSRWLLWCLLIIAALGVVGRAYQFQARSLWADELSTLAIAKYCQLLPKDGAELFSRKQFRDISSKDTFWTAKAADQNPPLYELLVKATVSRFGVGELASRLPSLIAGCLLLLFFAHQAWIQKDRGTQKALIWATLILSFHPILVMYSQEGRAYGVGVATLGAASLLWMLRWRRGSQFWTPPSWAEIILFTLACYSHYQAALMVAMLLTADAILAVHRRSIVTCIRLLALGLCFSVWLVLNGHAILYTANGGVSWGQSRIWDDILNTGINIAAALHWPWLALVGAVAVLVLGINSSKNATWQVCSARTAMAFGLLTLMYCGLCAAIALKAGMSHPRYFIFIVPFAAVCMGMLLAVLQNNAVILLVALSFVALGEPTRQLLETRSNDDFRSMANAASVGVDANTVFLFGWKPNRMFYRAALDAALKEDPEVRMLGLSDKAEAQSICNDLDGKTHVVAYGHAITKELTDAVYASCGYRWPKRNLNTFFYTYTEHWLSE